MSVTAAYKYDVAFSFLARDTSIAQRMADLISSAQTVFIYPKNQEDIAGSDGVEKLTRTFGIESRVVVVLYRSQWGETSWTRVEKDAIFDRGLERGWNFSLFVALDPAKPVPESIPKRRIYYDLVAFGIDGVAGAIKTRIAAMDGETCPESPTTHAARVSREMEFAALRHRFRTGEGVRLATPKFGRLKSFVFEQVAQINKQSSLRLQCEEKYDRYFRVVGPHASMVAGWRRYYANTLEDSELTVRLWTGRGRWPDMPDGGGFGLHEPQVLGERILDFNLLRTDVIGWIENNNHEFGAESLSESLLHWLIEANGKRSQQK